MSPSWTAAGPSDRANAVPRCSLSMAFHSSLPRPPRILRAYLSRPRLPGQAPLEPPPAMLQAGGQPESSSPTLSIWRAHTYWPGALHPEQSSRGLPGLASAGPSEPSDLDRRGHTLLDSPRSSRRKHAQAPVSTTCPTWPACVGNAHSLVETAVYLCPLRPGFCGVAISAPGHNPGKGRGGLTPHSRTATGPKQLQIGRRAELNCVVVADEKA